MAGGTKLKPQRCHKRRHQIKEIKSQNNMGYNYQNSLYVHKMLLVVILALTEKQETFSVGLG